MASPIFAVVGRLHLAAHHFGEVIQREGSGNSAGGRTLRQYWSGQRKDGSRASTGPNIACVSATTGPPPPGRRDRPGSPRPQSRSLPL